MTETVPLHMMMRSFDLMYTLWYYDNAFISTNKEIDNPIIEIRGAYMGWDVLPPGARVQGGMPPDIAQAETESKKSHANRGKQFENDMILTCRTYRARGEALIFKVPDPKKTAGGQYELGADGNKRWVMGPAIPDSAADKSVDFMGLARGRGYAFDAKENHDATSFSLDKIKPEQMEFLRDWEAQGGVSFFSIRQVAGPKGPAVHLVPFGVIAFYWKAAGRDNPFGRHPDKGARQSIPVEEVRRWPEIKQARGVLYDFILQIPGAVEQYMCEKAEGNWC